LPLSENEILMLFVKQILLFILLIPSVNSLAQKVDEVIGKYESYVGGKSNWDRVKTMIIHGTYDYGGMQFTFTSYAKFPNSYKFKVEQNGKYYAQGFNGTQGWKIDVFDGEKTPTMLSGKAALAMANEADVDLEEAIIGYSSKGHSAVFEGIDTIAQKACFKIKLTRKSGETEYYYFDAKTYALVMKNAVAKNPEMQGEWLTTFYSDYRTVSAIKIPFSVVRKLNDQVILTSIIDKVTLDAAINDQEFEP
jgi:hypothetical protein